MTIWLSNSLIYLSLVALTSTCVRSIFNLKDLLSNLDWVKRENRLLKKYLNKSVNEKYIICIPMLREQRVIKETIKYFSKMDYPKDKYKIVIVTTNKEVVEKEKNKGDLKKLAKDLSRQISVKNLMERYLKLFPKDVLGKVYKKYSGKEFNVVYKVIKKKYENLPTTHDLAILNAKSINSLYKTKLISVINYPHIEGVMSHQINYAVDELAKEEGNADSIFAVYNADSRPNLNTLRYVSYALKKFKDQTGVIPNLVQQSSLFTLNYQNYPNTIHGYILKAAGLFQTKWTLAKELTRFRSQSKNVIRVKDTFLSKLINTKISHCVGHGLFVRFNVLSREYLPTETINEDLPFGYYQCCKGEPILPLPVLENSEMPDTFKSLMNQKQIWFTPYLQYLSCRKRVLTNKKYRSRLEVDILTSQAITTGVVWLIQSAVLFIPLLIGVIFLNLPIILLWIVSILIYWFIPIGVIYRNLDELEEIAGRSLSKINFVDYVFSSLTGLFILATHSFGPILCVRDFAYLGLFGKAITKAKTER